MKIAHSLLVATIGGVLAGATGCGGDMKPAKGITVSSSSSQPATA